MTLMGFRQESQWKGDASAPRGGPFRLLHCAVLTRLSERPSGGNLSAHLPPCAPAPAGLLLTDVHTSTPSGAGPRRQVSGLMTPVMGAQTERVRPRRERPPRGLDLSPPTATCSPYCPALLLCCGDASVEAERLTRRAWGSPAAASTGGSLAQSQRVTGWEGPTASPGRWKWLVQEHS